MIMALKSTFKYAFLLLLAVESSLQTCTQISLKTRDDRQTLTTPGYPTSYANGLDTCWIVDTSGIASIAGESYIVQMTVDDTDMEKIGSSCYDYGEACDGANATDPRLAKWCNSRPYIIVSSGSKLHIRFYTSSSNSGGAVFKGFSATLSVGVKAGSGSLSSQYSPKCTSVSLSATNLTYTITSPNYPALYTNSMDQCWVLYIADSIPIAVNYRIRVQVLDSQLETSSTCHYDDLQARDGDDATSTLVSMWCGETIPPVMTSCRQRFYIRMRSDHFGTYRGFRAYANIVSKTESCSLEAQPLSLGTILGIVMGLTFGVVLIVIVIVVCSIAKRKTKKTKIRRVKPKGNDNKKDKVEKEDVAVVPAPNIKHPSYYNQNKPPPYPGGDYVPPLHGATMTTGFGGYAQPAAPAYNMTAMPGSMPDAY